MFFRPYWRSYYPDTDVVIYVIDSSDKERMDTSKEELLMMLEVISNKKEILMFTDICVF